MNEFFRQFVDTAKRLSAARGLCWDIPCGPDGKVEKRDRWDLTKLAGEAPPPTNWLAQLGYFSGGLESLNSFRAEKGLSHISESAMPPAWQDLFKAVVLNQILVRRNRCRHATDNVGRYIRLLAACADHLDPWDITGETVQLAYNVALNVGESGKNAANLEMLIRMTFDDLHLADRGPLARFCTPYPTAAAKGNQVAVDRIRDQNLTFRNTDRIRSELQQRKTSEKLPESRAFWELVRIVFTEQPKTFSDAVRFAQVKLGIITGFRIGENATLPIDWQRSREYVDIHGRPAGERGGISRSLMIRYFAEKQQEDQGPEGMVFYENTQHVPPMFEDIVIETLEKAARLTAPLRLRLRAQAESGRLLTEFSPDALRPAWDLYTRVSGAFWFLNEPPPDRLITAYREQHDPDILEDLRRYQLARMNDSRMDDVKSYWLRHVTNGGLTLRDAAGNPFHGRVRWNQAHLRVGEVENFIREALPTKLSDTAPFRLADGQSVYPHELLFLMPVRALIENRNDGIVDVNRYLSIGRVSSVDLHLHLGAVPDNLFSRYGETDEDKQHKLNTHSLRHLQNAELLRLGIADTIVTKRFGRRSVTQTYEYDHRSLAEELDSIELPDAAYERLGPKAQEALKLIQGGRVTGPIVDEFRLIQRELGDDAAFDYLEAESDGLHATPYGLCMNSFTIDACPKHLECFNGCRHLARTGLPTEDRALTKLRDVYIRLVAKIECTPVAAKTLGWQNQLAHAETRLENIELALATSPGCKPFPDGPDLFRSVDDKVGTTLLDRRKG